MEVEMKFFRKGIPWFFITQIFISAAIVLIMLTVGFHNPLERFYDPQHGTLYIALNSLFFLPVYLAAGFALGRILHIDAGRRALLLTFGICAGLMTAPYVAAVLMDDHSIWMIYAMANPPWWWMMMMLSTAAHYASPVNLLFSVAPAAVFAMGIYLQKKCFRSQGDTA